VIPLSVLDLSPVTTATPGSAALRNSLDLARLADRLGYSRYWLAEHHNLASIASSAPEIMIGQVAAATSHIRGSGGVMREPCRSWWPNGSKCWKRCFRRIDLGLGRAPGTDPVLLRIAPALGRAKAMTFWALQELMLERGGFPPEHPFRNVHAVPADVALPPVWLGSSGCCAELAAAAGMGLAFAHHFADHDAASAMLSYRTHFKPSKRCRAAQLRWRQSP
jgi:alkanesulfonate monooxygenase SsuD/methylene tetrahydromethanopterin reductase-like flavin-dependent oxidoreductase (luciferase family)